MSYQGLSLFFFPIMYMQRNIEITHALIKRSDTILTWTMGQEKKNTDFFRWQNCTVSIPKARSRCFLHVSNQPCINVNVLFNAYNVTSSVSSFRNYLKSALALHLSFIKSPIIAFSDKYMKFSKTPSYFSHLFSVIILREGELRRQEGQKLTEQTKEKNKEGCD